LISPHKPKPVVHVHPVARWLFKCWNNEKMAAVIDWLELERGARVIVTSSADPRELERTRAIIAQCRSQPVLLAGQVSLGQMVALSEQADCFLGVDTAPMHIAAAVGAPVVALFGPTSTVAWRPWCERQVTLHKACQCQEQGKDLCPADKIRQCMESVSVEEAQSALAQFLPAQLLASGHRAKP
jgi:heptosyltransferase-3